VTSAEPWCASVRKITVEELSRLDQSSFISVLGDIFGRAVAEVAKIAGFRLHELIVD
jgi:2-oxo-4-hydroxy-4-carboxy--5-ureidoimidazoline (OHCU) decarboxylase